MILILIALVSMLVISIWGANRQEFGFLNDFICPVFAVIGFFGLIVYAYIVFAYISADYQAKIINQEYGTSYTQEEVFFASNVIDTIRHLDRKRIELNGDLMADK